MCDWQRLASSLGMNADRADDPQMPHQHRGVLIVGGDEQIAAPHVNGVLDEPGDSLIRRELGDIDHLRVPVAVAGMGGQRVGPSWSSLASYRHCAGVGFIFCQRHDSPDLQDIQNLFHAGLHGMHNQHAAAVFE